MNKQICQQAYDLRYQGHTFPEVGKALNISATYARHMVEINHILQTREVLWTEGLPARTGRAIRSAGFTSKQQLIQALQQSPGLIEQCADLGNIGRKALMAWLQL